MTWLFSKALCESWHCSQEPEAESSEATCSDSEPFAQLNVTPTPHKFSRNDKTMDALSLSRFGLTLRLLTDDHGEELLTSFRAGFRVRTYQLPEPVKESMESGAGCGEKWPASFAKYDHDSSSWKTHQLLLLGGLDEFSETWPRWGSMRNGECWERPTLELPTRESESGLWQTPVADDAVERKAGKWNSRGEPKLSAEAKLWPTPTVCGNYNRKGASKTSGDGLATAVKNWPTPTASASKGSSPASLTRKSGADRSRDRLDHAVMASDGGQLNPPWVEWLMGWPIGWTELRPLEMARFLEWQQQHSSSYAEETSKGAA